MGAGKKRKEEEGEEEGIRPTLFSPTLHPRISLTQRPVWMSHSRQVLSFDPVAMYCPLG